MFCLYIIVALRTQHCWASQLERAERPTVYGWNRTENIQFQNRIEPCGVAILKKRRKLHSSLSVAFSAQTRWYQGRISGLNKIDDIKKKILEWLEIRFCEKSHHGLYYVKKSAFITFRCLPISHKGYRSSSPVSGIVPSVQASAVNVDSSLHEWQSILKTW